MINVSTKKMKNGKWVCYATINGYDYSFEGSGINDVQMQMANLIDKLFPDVRPKVNSKDAVMFFTKHRLNKKGSYIGYAKNRIDNNPIG